jgi:hypothetical protein
MVERDGITFTACKRSQADSCMSYLKEHHDELGSEWMGCWMPAFIDTGWPHDMIPVFGIFISVAASFRDSETMDITVTYPRPYCGKQIWSKNDVQIVAKGDAGSKWHVADVVFFCPDGPPGVPIVDATEKGGKTELSHRYR